MEWKSSKWAQSSSHFHTVCFIISQEDYTVIAVNYFSVFCRAGIDYFTLYIMFLDEKVDDISCNHLTNSFLNFSHTAQWGSPESAKRLQKEETRHNHIWNLHNFPTASSVIGKCTEGVSVCIYA